MTTTNISSALEYLNTALESLKALDLLQEDQLTDPNEFADLMVQVLNLEPDRANLLAHTLCYEIVVNRAVLTEIVQPDMIDAYEEIVDSFDSIREDSENMVEQYSDGKISTMERASNMWMKMTRGDIASRFLDIQKSFHKTQEQCSSLISREQSLLEAYLNFRRALKQAEKLGVLVIEAAEAEMETNRQHANDAVTSHTRFDKKDAAGLARLEVARDEKLRGLQSQEARYQFSRTLFEKVSIAYNASEIIMARLAQSMMSKERIQAQSQSFVSTNEIVMSALTASFTGMYSAHDIILSLEESKRNVDKSLDVLSNMGEKISIVHEVDGYRSAVSIASVKMLVDSIQNYQTRSREILQELTDQTEMNQREIQNTLRDSQRRLSVLMADGNALIENAQTAR